MAQTVAPPRESAERRIFLDRRISEALERRGIGRAEILRFGFIHDELEVLSTCRAMKAQQILLDIGRAMKEGLPMKLAKELVLSKPGSWPDKLELARQLQSETLNLCETAAIRIAIHQASPRDFVKMVEAGISRSLDSFIPRDQAFLLAANHPGEFEDLLKLTAEGMKTPHHGMVMVEVKKGAKIRSRLSAPKDEITPILSAMALSPYFTFGDVTKLFKNIGKRSSRRRDIPEQALLLEKIMGELPGALPSFCKELATNHPNKWREVVSEVFRIQAALPELSLAECQQVVRCRSSSVNEFIERYKSARAQGANASASPGVLARRVLDGMRATNKANGKAPAAATEASAA